MDKIKKIRLTVLDKRHLKNLVKAMEHFKNREITVYADSNEHSLDECHPAGFKGVEIFYYGPLADDFAKENGIDIDNIEASDTGYKSFMIGDIGFRMRQVRSYEL